MKECVNLAVRFSFAAAIVMVITAATRGDVVELKDGRRYEGAIVGEYDEGVVIDTVTGNTRATLAVWASQVKNITRSELPRDFYSRTEHAGAAHERKKKEERTGTPYLEIPIRGEIGNDVTATGIGAALRYARQHRIHDILFVIDTPGGSLEDIKGILDELARVEGDFYYRAVVRRAEGVAVTLPMVMHATYLLPDVMIGPAGSIKVTNDATNPLQPRAQAARNFVASVAQARGRPPLLARALVDARPPLVVWRDTNGMVQAADSLPEGVPAARVLVRKEADRPLIPSRDELVAIGMGKRLDPVGDDIIGALGKAEGVTDWQPFSDFGLYAVERAADLDRTRRRVAEAIYRTDMRDTDSAKREDDASWQQVNNHWQRFLAVDPYQGQYATYDVSVGDGSLFFGGRWREVRVSTWTRNARQQWHDRTMAAIDALYDMREDLRQMSDINTPRELGENKLMVSPSQLYEDSANLINRLWRERNRRGP